MPTPQIEVFLPDGTTQSFPLTEERVVVGTSTKCHVQLDRPELAPEHLLLSPRADGCWVAVARNVPTPVIIDAVPFERGMVPWGKAIDVGPLRFLLDDGKRAAAAKKSADKDKDKDKQGINPVILVAAGILVPLCLYMSFQDPAGDTPRRVSTPPPELFDSLQRPCPQADPALLVPTAQESGRIALSKAERMPFRTQDGIQAVNYYAQASACYRAAGDAASADAAMRQATALRNRLEDEYRAHRFRLERALEQERIEDALYEVRMITALVSHRPGPYLTAVGTLERQLNLKIDQAAAAAR